MSKIKFIIDEDALKADENTAWEIKQDPLRLIPKRATKGSAGYDLVSPCDFEIKTTGSRFKKINSYVKLELPEDMVAYLHVRSSLGIMKDTVLANGIGVIDSDFKDCISIPLRYVGNNKLTVKAGERIAQLVFHKYETADDVVTEVRTGGIGSTGN